ncbi:hypothetical protein ES703_114947 [subsurface metagenome]
MRGNEISFDTSLVNLKIIKYGSFKFFGKTQKKEPIEKEKK